MARQSLRKPLFLSIFSQYEIGGLPITNETEYSFSMEFIKAVKHTDRNQ